MRDARIIILLYHRVSEKRKIEVFEDPYSLKVGQENFRDHLQFIKDEFNVIDFKELKRQFEQRELSYDRQAIVTFDDGYADNFYNAFPVLQSFKVPATIFLTTDPIDYSQELWTDRLFRLVFQGGIFEKQKRHTFFAKLPLYFKYRRYIALRNKLIDLNRVERDEYMSRLCSCQDCAAQTKEKHDLILTWQQINEMSASGISFGAHSRSHQNLSKLPVKDVYEEIANSKQSIESHIKSVVDLFAYPYGGVVSYNEATKKILRDLKFTFACTTNAGHNDLSSDPLELKRITVLNWRRSKFSNKIEKFIK